MGGTLRCLDIYLLATCPCPREDVHVIRYTIAVQGDWSSFMHLMNSVKMLFNIYNYGNLCKCCVIWEKANCYETLNLLHNLQTFRSNFD